MVNEADALEILDALSVAGVRVWVDGGWGVDALLGTQTREHGDLDLALPIEDLPGAVAALGARGFAEHDDERPTRLELRDEAGRAVDLHPLAFDDRGNGLQRLQDGAVGIYAADGLQGRGTLGGRPVACLSAPLQLEFHLGYEPRPVDRHDVARLCRRFGLPVPAAYS